MRTFIYFLGFFVACAGTAMVAKNFKPPSGPLGVLLIVVGASICIFILFFEEIKKWRVARKLKKLYRERDEEKRKSLC